MYVTVEGQFDVNEFSMLIWEMLFNPDVIEITVDGNTPLNNPLVTVGDFINSTERFACHNTITHTHTPAGSTQTHTHAPHHTTPHHTPSLPFHTASPTPLLRAMMPTTSPLTHPLEPYLLTAHWIHRNNWCTTSLL